MTEKEMRDLVKSKIQNSKGFPIALYTEEERQRSLAYEYYVNTCRCPEYRLKDLISEEKLIEHVMKGGCPGTVAVLLTKMGSWP